MNTFKGFINYGCLGSEKRPRYTAGNPNPTATTSEALEFTLPDGWLIEENEIGQWIVTAPWGWKYDPNELLEGKQSPFFSGIDKDGNGFRIALDCKPL